MRNLFNDVKAVSDAVNKAEKNKQIIVIKNFHILSGSKKNHTPENILFI
jgi:hypothetical protein